MSSHEIACYHFKLFEYHRNSSSISYVPTVQCKLLAVGIKDTFYLKNSSYICSYFLKCHLMSQCQKSVQLRLSFLRTNYLAFCWAEVLGKPIIFISCTAENSDVWPLNLHSRPVCFFLYSLAQSSKHKAKCCRRRRNSYVLQDSSTSNFKWIAKKARCKAILKS